MENYKPEIAMASLQFSYAVISLTGRAALLEGLSPRVFVVYRQAIAALTISPVAYFLRYPPPFVEFIDFIDLQLLTNSQLHHVTINQNLYFQGIYLASSSMGSATGNLVPGITFVMATIFGLEKVNVRSIRSIAKILGTIICVSGALTMALIKGPQLVLNNVSRGSEDWLLGCGFLFASACCWSIWLILQVPVTRAYPDHLSVSAWMCSLGALQSGIVTFFMEPDLNAWKLTSYLQLISCLFTGVVGSGIAFFVQAWCISKRGPLFSALFNPLCTVIVTVLATFLLDEKIYIGSLVGAVGVIVGLYAVLWGKSKDYANKVEVEIDPKSADDETRRGISDIEEPLLCSKI
ncbi:WAT1-related protein At4g30420 [Linum grandiflorum]